MASFTCRTCQIEVASVAAETGLCDDCTLREQGKTVSADNPTASFHFVQTDEQATTRLCSEESENPNRLPVPLGYVDAKFIDKGGMGQVFRALELSTGRTVAIKMLHACRMRNDILGRFSVEAKALAALQHPNLVFLYEFNERANPPYLVMEYVDGVSAYARLKADGPYKIREAVHVIHQATLGIEAAHKRNVIHRDIKPSNILIDQQSVVKLTDFGLAKRLNEKDELTIQGGIAGGTPGYMSPEQINPRLGEVGVATDVWALGATLYCLLAGQPPYPSNINDMLDVLSKDHKPVRFHRKEVSPVLDAIVQKCLMFEPAERYPSAEALANDLDSYLNNRPTVVRPPSFAGRLWNTARNLQTATVVAWSLALLVLFIIGASFFTKRQESQAEEKPPIIWNEDDARKAYFDECRKKLQAKEKVVLIGDESDGPPVHVAWPYMGYKFMKPFGRMGAAQLTCGEKGFAVLLDEPGIDRYTLTGEFQQIGIGVNNADGRYVGFAFGLQNIKRKSGRDVDSFITFKFQEGFKGLNKLGEKNALLSCEGIHYGENGQQQHFPISFHLGDAPFKPVQHLPGEWRRLVVDVSPEGFSPGLGLINAKMSGLTTTEPRPTLLRWQQGMNMNLLMDQQKNPNDSYVDLAWKANKPLGIWCESSSVLLRNVEIIPVSEKSKD